jgi:dienelactone hydrolase
VVEVDEEEPLDVIPVPEDRPVRKGLRRAASKMEQADGSDGLTGNRRKFWVWLTVSALGMGLVVETCSIAFRNRESSSAGNRLAPVGSNFGTPIPLPPLGAGQQIEPGVLVHEVFLAHGQSRGRVWIYLPERDPDSPIPCVLIAAAGAPLIHGIDLSAGDQPEHLPYARAGFAVVAYAIDGELTAMGRTNDAQLVAAATAFKNARAGLANARLALDYVAAKVPGIDPKRIYAVGHSSAATLALLAAADDPRISACVAFAPCTDVENRVPRQVVQALGSRVPDYANFLHQSSPLHQVSRLRCPVLLFHAQDDSNVPIRETEQFVEKLKKFNSQVTFVRASQGGHYDAMIRDGIPEAIRWLQRASPDKSGGNKGGENKGAWSR